MKKKPYIQPKAEWMIIDSHLMQTISQNTGGDIPVVDDGEELGGNSSSLWDSEPAGNGDIFVE